MFYSRVKQELREEQGEKYPIAIHRIDRRWHIKCVKVREEHQLTLIAAKRYVLALNNI